jgi:dTDP-4-dehydrorhamnose 3,5-epimerase
MNVRETSLSGVHLIDLDSFRDERGLFVRAFCATTFEAAGLNGRWVQTNVSCTARRGMLRGLHFQRAPGEEIKLIECLTGAVHDVIVDLRQNSPSYGRWEAFELAADRPIAVYAPAGCAHGFQCLTDDCRLLYHMSTAYVAELSAGVRWNDPDLAIIWPVKEPALSDRDASLPTLAEIS